MPFKLGGTTFPLSPPDAGKSLLAQVDPFAAAFLPFWRDVLRANLSAAYVEAMAGQALGGSAAACMDASVVDGDDDDYLERTALRLPFLALYPTGIDPEGGTPTFGHNAEVRTYTLDYVLPAAVNDQVSRGLGRPFLVAAHGLLTASVYAPTAATALAASGCTDVAFGRSTFGFLPRTDSRLPLLRSEVRVAVQDADASVGPALAKVVASIAAAAEGGNPPFPIAQVQVTP
jgi:hypothetical protein